MQRSKRCPKCQSEKIGFLRGLPDTLASETETTDQYLGRVLDNGRPRRVGHLVAYVCTACGYLETYVQEPDRVPFEQLQSFSWVQLNPTPYR